MLLWIGNALEHFNSKSNGLQSHFNRNMEVNKMIFPKQLQLFDVLLWLIGSFPTPSEKSEKKTKRFNKNSKRLPSLARSFNIQRSTLITNMSQGHHLHSYFNRSIEVCPNSFLMLYCGSKVFFQHRLRNEKKYKKPLKLPKATNSHVTPFSHPTSLSHIAILPCWSPWSSAPAFRLVPGRRFQIIQ